jgi:hypothetical protein
MATNAYYLNQYISTTLASVGGIDDSATTGIILASVTNIATDKPGIACITYTDPIDVTKAEWITYTSIDSGTKELEGVTRGQEGFSAKAHNNGATVAFPLSESHINNLNDALIIGGSETNLLQGILDEDTMASDSAVKGATQQSIKAYVGEIDGWKTLGLSGVTVTRESTDNPTVVLRFDADVRDYIWKGMRLKATENSIVHYFIVSVDPTDDSGDTLVTCLSEIDTATPTQAKNLIGTETISDVAYAPPTTMPKGFSIDPMSWTIKVTYSDFSNNSPTTDIWYNLGSVSIIIPIGIFKLDYECNFGGDRTNNTTLVFQSTLSTANNTESDKDFTGRIQVGGATGTQRVSGFVKREKVITFASKTTKYLNFNTTTGASGLYHQANAGTTVVRATSALL